MLTAGVCGYGSKQLFIKEVFSTNFMKFFGLGGHIISQTDTMVARSESGNWCTICGYGSAALTDVHRHIEAKHLDLQIPCKFCHKICKTRLNLTRHLKKFHPESKSNFKSIIEWHLRDLK